MLSPVVFKMYISNSINEHIDLRFPIFIQVSRAVYSCQVCGASQDRAHTHTQVYHDQTARGSESEIGQRISTPTPPSVGNEGSSLLTRLTRWFGGCSKRRPATDRESGSPRHCGGADECERCTCDGPCGTDEGSRDATLVDRVA